MNQVANTRSNPIVEFKKTIGRMLDAGEFALPSNVSTDAFRSAAIVAAQDNPQILSCSPETVFRSIRKLAAAGLVPDGREAALVPFKGSCTEIKMVYGLIKMARRSGDVKDIRAHTVYQRELDEGRFEYTIGDEERLEHRPILFGDKGEPVAYYAIAKLKDGSIVRTFMDKTEIEKIRKGAASQRGNGQPQGIWKDHYEQMAHKTVIRRLCKRLDLSSEDMRHISIDDDVQTIRDVTPEEPRTLAQRLTQPDPEPEQADTPETDDEPLTGEILDGTGKHWTELVNTDDAAPMDAGWDDGVAACKVGKDRTECPEGDNAAAWLAGYDQQKQFQEEEA